MKETTVLHLTDEMHQKIMDCKSINDWPQWLSPSTLDSRVKRFYSENVGHYARVSAPIKKGEILMYVNGTRIDRAHRWSIQIEDQLYVTGAGAINHVCIEPNLVIDPENCHFIARRDIESGEELNINYLTFERVMSSPFQCNCKHEKCFGLIGGFECLSADNRRKVAKDFPISSYLSRLSS